MQPKFSNWKSRASIGALVVAGTALASTAVVLFRGGGDGNRLNVNEPQPAAKQQAPGDEYVVVGGVRRKATDLRPAQGFVRERAKRGADSSRRVGSSGRIQPIRADANPHVASIAKALRERKHPERFSTLIQPTPFDVKTYRRDPQAYINTIEPGRVYQPARPGPNVPRIASIGRSHPVIAQGESVVLRVKAVSQAPVTFTSFDSGAFENQLSSITVEANEDGIAEARFTATPGTISNVNILAASPLTSGQLKYVVKVLPPSQQAAQAQE